MANHRTSGGLQNYLFSHISPVFDIFFTATIYIDIPTGYLSSYAWAGYPESGKTSRACQLYSLTFDHQILSLTIPLICILLSTLCYPTITFSPPFLLLTFNSFTYTIFHIIHRCLQASPIDQWYSADPSLYSLRF